MEKQKDSDPCGSKETKTRRRRELGSHKEADDADFENFCINDLPFTVLVKIFSFCSAFELTRNLSLVCKQWKDVSRYPSLWKAVRFGAMSDKKLKCAKQFLQKATLLEKISIKRAQTLRVLKAVPRAERLKKLTMENTVISERDMTSVFNMCRNIERLSIKNSNIESYKPISELQNLVQLKLANINPDDEVSRGKDDVKLAFRLIAEKCKNLSDISLNCIPDVGNFITLIKDRIKRLMLVFVTLKEESLASITRCPKLKRLTLGFSDMESDNNRHHFGILKELEFFEMDEFVCSYVEILHIFSQGTLSNMKEIHLNIVPEINDEVFRCVVDSCPALEKMVFIRSRLDRFSVSEDVLIHMLRVCPRLHCLVICHLESITVRFLNEIPKYLFNLTVLVVEGCKNIDELDLLNVSKSLPNTNVSSVYKDFVLVE